MRVPDCVSPEEQGPNRRKIAIALNDQGSKRGIAWFRQLCWSGSGQRFRYISTMTKPAVLSLVLLAVFAPLWGDAAPAPFSLAVVPSKSFGDGGNISMSHDKPDDFYVVLTNVSGEPQVIWELRNSWGYQTISFEVTTAKGKTFVYSRGPEEFTKNSPTTAGIKIGVQLNSPCAEEKQTRNNAGEFQNQRSP